MYGAARRAPQTWARSLAYWPAAILVASTGEGLGRAHGGLGGQCGGRRGPSGLAGDRAWRGPLLRRWVLVRPGGAGRWPARCAGQVRLMLIDDLRGVFLFEGLGDEQLRDLIAVGDEVRFESGDVLFREGEAAAFWWVLLAARGGEGAPTPTGGYVFPGVGPPGRPGGRIPALSSHR